MLPATSIMSRWQTKKFNNQDLIIYVLNRSENKSVLHWIVGLIALVEALISQNTTVTIATKTTSNHNVASSLMSLILSHNLVASESKATFNPHCGFSFNEVSDVSNDTNITFKQQYGCSLKMALTKSNMDK